MRVLDAQGVLRLLWVYAEKSLRRRRWWRCLNCPLRIHFLCNSTFLRFCCPLCCTLFTCSRFDKSLRYDIYLRPGVLRSLPSTNPCNSYSYRIRHLELVPISAVSLFTISQHSNVRLQYTPLMLYPLVLHQPCGHLKIECLL